MARMPSEIGQMGEIDGEYEFNSNRRLINSPAPAPLTRTLAIPIPGPVAEKVPWCNLKVSFYLSKAKGFRVWNVWDKIIEFIQDKIGYIRSGSRKENRTTITISSYIDLFKDIELSELEDQLQGELGCRVHIDHVDTFS